MYKSLCIVGQEMKEKEMKGVVLSYPLEVIKRKKSYSRILPHRYPIK